MFTPYHFFLKHAGYSYNPATQTRMRGRIECAQTLARAESHASRAGYSFEWSIDPDVSSADWDSDDGGDHWNTWACVMRDDTGRVCTSLGGIDFGRDGEPWGDPYRRVVEAELSSAVVQ